MKKYIYVLFLVIVMTPSVVSAAWWNPISWFQKKEVSAPQVQPKGIEPVQNQAEKINELQEQLDELKNKQVETTPVEPTPSPIVKKVDNSATVKAQQNALAARQRADEQARMQAAQMEVDRQAQQEAEKARLEAQKAQEEALAKEKEANDPHNSAECKTAKKAYDNIHDQMEKLSDKMEKAKPGTEEDDKATSRLADLAIKSNSISNTYYEACEPAAYYSIPVRHTTVCNFIGNTLYCN